MSLDAGKGQPSPGDGLTASRPPGTSRCALALTALIPAAVTVVSTRQPDAARATDVKALLNWILTAGSRPLYLRQFEFQPLPPQVVSVAQALAAKISN